VTNRPNIAMRLRAFEFLLGHLLFSVPLGPAADARPRSVVVRRRALN
jgi:hypothetical protein